MHEEKEEISIVSSSEKAGFLPGTAIYTGNVDIPVNISITVLRGNRIIKNKEVTVEELARELENIRGENYVWINVCGMKNTETIKKVTQYLNIHSLFLEDLLNVDQRPRLIISDNGLFFILKWLELNNNHLVKNQVAIFSKNKILLTFFETSLPLTKKVKKTLEVFLGQVKFPGPDILAYLIMDQIVDNYFKVMEKLEDLIEFLEDRAINEPEPELLEEIQDLKREVIIVRRIFMASREIFSKILRLRPEPINPSSIYYFDDVYDHLVQLVEEIDSLREILFGLTELYMSSVGNKSNDVMMILTIIATIFIPHTFIVGVYGMNFQYMPELNWRYGYFAVWILMIVLTILEIWYFKKKGWLK